jgi:PAS domain-containing protein
MLLQRGLIKLILILTSFGFLVVATEFVTHRFVFSGQMEEIALINAVKRTKERENIFSEFFTRSENTLISIKENEKFSQFIEGTLSVKHDVELLALSLVKSQNDIMKIRYIDESGMEIIRAERAQLDEPTIVVPEARLQNKSHRYFYSQSIIRPANQIWFSDLDLNMEYGKVEVPYKATLRAVMPLSYQDQFKGILIINYFMQPLFDDLTNAPLYNMILADSDGEVLIHYDSDRNWSRYTGRENLSADIPNLSNIVQNETYRSPTFFSRQLDLPLKQRLILILSLNNKYLSFQESLSQKYLKYSEGVTLFITVIFGLFFSVFLNRFFVDYESRGNYINELEKLNRRIKNLLQKNKAYMEMASDGIHVLDKQGNVVAFSYSFASMLGYTEEEAARLNVRDWDALVPPDQFTE